MIAKHKNINRVILDYKYHHDIFPDVLNLTIKAEYFDMILSGIKEEEYRAIKKYWDRILYGGEKNFDFVYFRNGYSPDSRAMILDCKDIEVKEGREEWGAVKGVEYFAIGLGDILATDNL